MKLLYLAIAYMGGIMLGRFAWDLELVDCQTLSWPWMILLPILPLPFLLASPQVSPRVLPQSAMRWPKWAHFQLPNIPRPYALPIALLLIVVVGIFRYISHPIAPCWNESDLAFYNLPADDAYKNSAPQVTVRGYVSSYPLFEDTTQKMNVWVQQILLADRSEWVAVNGEVALKTENFVHYKYGDPVELRGRLTTPNDFEDFSYREYLARKNIHSLFNLQGNGRINLLDGPNQGTWYLRAIYNVRARGEALINQALPEPYAGLANGMLLGIEAGIDDELYEKFNLTGTSHVIVISGSNVAIISAVFLAIGARIAGQRRAMWPALIGIGCYALLVGGDGAVMRAALMGAVFVIATSLGRRNTALVSLALACQLLTLFNPLTLWDVGFQLSSAATAGLILFANDISDFFTGWANKFWKKILPTAQKNRGTKSTSAEPLVTSTKSFMGGLIQEGLLITIAANITTLPLVVYYFDRLSVVSLLTNLLISAVQPYIMLWGSAALVIGVVGTYLQDWFLFLEITGTNLAQFFGLVAQFVMMVPLFCLKWTTMMVVWTAGLPGASLLIEWYDKPYLIGTYTLLGVYIWLSSLSTKSPVLLTLQHLVRLAKADLINSFWLPTIKLKRRKQDPPKPQSVDTLDSHDTVSIDRAMPSHFPQASLRNEQPPANHRHQPNYTPDFSESRSLCQRSKMHTVKSARFIPKPRKQPINRRLRYAHRLKPTMIIIISRHPYSCRSRYGRSGRPYNNQLISEQK